MLRVVPNVLANARRGWKAIELVHISVRVNLVRGLNVAMEKLQ